MTIETDQDLQALRVVGRIVAQILRDMGARLEPGMTTRELDQLGQALFDHHDVRSAPRLTYGFPGCTCISINEEAAHGIPGDRVIHAGDMVNIDVSAERNGYFADTGGSFVVPPSSPLKERLCSATRSALAAAAFQARADRPMNGIGKAIQKVAREQGFRVIKNLCSHGVGRALHEEPKEIAGYYVPQDTRRLVRGMVMTIEPFLSTKSRLVTEAGDGWTLVGARGNLSAQYEHTLVITRGEPILLTVC
jgi:methionyl aminopeptidase